MKFIWMKDGKELVETGNVRFKNEQGYSVLLFEPVEVNSGGNYTCVVKNRAGLDSYTTFLDVEGKCAPKVLPFSFPNRPKVLGRTSVMCSAADGTQPFTFSWLKDGSSVTDVKNVREEKKSDYSVLIIEPVEAVHAGNYTCIVKNKAGFDSHTAYLEVEAPPMWKSVPGNTDVVKGKELVLFCNAHGSPSPKVSWMFRQVPPKIIAFHFRKTIKPGENARTTCLVEAGDAPMTFSWLRNGVDASLTKNVQVNTQADFSILNVSPVDATSAGNFTCIVKNKAGFDSFTAYLDVEVAPKIQPFHFRKTAKPGETVRTSCLVEAGDRPMKFSWLRNGHDASSLPNVKIDTHSEVSLLTIAPVSASSAGNFTCIVKNKAGFDSFTSLLEVEVTPKIIAFSFAGTAKPGNNVRTTCLLAEGDMPITFTWLRNGMDASHSKNVHIVSHSDYSLLNINPVDGQSAGNYTCIAKNRAGFDSFTAYLDVEGRTRTQLNIFVFSFFLLQAISQGKEVPEIRPFSFSKNIPVGGKALVTCWITSGVQPVTFSWLKDGQSLNTVQGTRLKTDPDYSVLLLEPVVPSHVGNYTCIAKNKFGFDSYTTVLEVESSPTWKKVSGDSSVILDGTLVIECSAAGFPQPTLTFQKIMDKLGNQDTPKTDNERLTVHRNGTVIIKQVSMKDAGAYACEAQNGVPPSVRHTVKVIVNGENGNLEP
ncbi:hypothetical protein HPB50_018636 [Hyalomma asiaticum]|uniref:Uncharacterized protein n=1 Tax=Hyalomma asiaticum TaxID=266040 RepID=A0ACB7S1C6_HYAAI|nr:hypothetical protein HPB50_018636 [Hyalomma asiaticum]